MITNGFVLSILTSYGFVTVFKRLPAKVQQMAIRHPLFAELGAGLTAVFLFGTNPTGLMAGGFTSLWVTLGLKAQEDPELKSGLAAVTDGLKKAVRWVVGGLKSLIKGAAQAASTH